MKIIKLVSENVKRISAVAITPAADGSLVTIGGKNGAGKSSVLDSIAYALGGEKLVPSEPIRTGQGEAKIVVDLGDYIVTRRFYREKVEDPTVKEGASWTPTKSVLIVTNKEGARYPSPQVLLDKLYGKLTFDPLAFSKEKPPQQNEILRRLVNLDFTEQNGQRKTLFDSRAMDKKTLGFAEAKLTTLPKHPTPQGVYDTVETPIDDVRTEIRRGQELRQAAQDASQAVYTANTAIEDLTRKRAELAATIRRLREELEVAESQQATIDITVDERVTHLAALKSAADASIAAVPDFNVLDAKLKQIDDANKQARENRVYLEQEQHVKSLQAQIAEQTKGIEKIDTDKAAALQVWMEFVTSHADGVSVMLEDGHLA